jgi:hypothetical protein
MKTLSQVLDNLPLNAGAENNAGLPIPQHGLTQAAGMTSQALTLMRDLIAQKPTEPAAIDRGLKAAVNSWPNLSVSYRKTSVVSPEYGFLRTREIPEFRTNEPDGLKELLRALELASRPCPKDEVLKELYAMSLGMARRKDQDTDFKMMIAVYANDLSDYPRDVILDACGEIRREQRFFPTISDLRDACEERFEFRRALLIETARTISGVRRLSAG